MELENTVTYLESVNFHHVKFFYSTTLSEEVQKYMDFFYCSEDLWFDVFLIKKLTFKENLYIFIQLYSISLENAVPVKIVF